MALSPEEKQQYLAEITPGIEAAADAAMLKHFNRTYRGDPADLARAARLAKLDHGQQNGSARPQDSLEQIKLDFPSLFSAEDDAV